MWINTSKLDKEAFERICKIADYVSYDRDSTAYCSVSTVCEATRIVELRKRYIDEVIEDPTQVIWRIMGSAVHDTLYNALGYKELINAKCQFADNILLLFSDNMLREDINIPDTLLEYYMIYLENVAKIDTSFIEKYKAEERLAFEILGKKIVGTNDLYNTQNYRISDYKVTKASKITYKSFREWIHQLNCYAYQRRVHGYQVDMLEINALIRDWQWKDAKWNKNYPQHALVTIPLELWDIEKQKRYLEYKVGLLLEAETQSEDELPLCSRHERWQGNSKIAVVDAEYFSVHSDNIDKIQELLGESMWLDGLLNIHYPSRFKMLHALAEVYDEKLVKQYEEDVLSVTGVRKVRESDSTKLKKALKIEKTGDRDEAMKWIRESSVDIGTVFLEHRESEPIRCSKNYCGVNEHCSYYRNHVEGTYYL